MNQYPMPVILLTPEHTQNGTIYHPSNGKAVVLSQLLGKIIEDKHLPEIERLGFAVAFPNGQPILHPRDAYKRQLQGGPKHISDLA